jgi:uncharacterized protein (TIGR03435 family)
MSVNPAFNDYSITLLYWVKRTIAILGLLLIRRTPMKSSALALFALTIAAVSWAQTPAAKKLVFDVASIKLNTAPQGTPSIGDQPGGRFVASRVTLRRLIQFAYRGNQDILRGPDWLDSDTWDVQAKAPEGTVTVRASPLDATRPDTLAFMVQSLLEDRFKLKSHQETRELPLYNLTVAKNGAKIKLSEDQTPPAAFVGVGAGAAGVERGGIRLGRRDFEAKAQPIELLAVALGALYVDRPVIDHTGLKGLYDLRLQWTADAGLNTPSVGPSLLNALEEQLGLKLEAGKGPLTVLVIDSVEKPSEN